MRAFRPSEEAERLTRHDVVRAVNVGEAEELPAERVADEARGSGVHHVDAGRLACPSCAAPARAGCRGKEIKEEEAVAARGAGDSEQARDVGVVVGGLGPGVDDVGGDDEVGGERGLRELEGRARVRRVDQHRAGDHRPRRVRRGGRGEPAAEARGGCGGGEGAVERERHLGVEECASEAAVGSAAAEAGGRGAVVRTGEAEEWVGSREPGSRRSDSSDKGWMPSVGTVY